MSQTSRISIWFLTDSMFLPIESSNFADLDVKYSLRVQNLPYSMEKTVSHGRRVFSLEKFGIKNLDICFFCFGTQDIAQGKQVEETYRSFFELVASQHASYDILPIVFISLPPCTSSTEINGIKIIAQQEDRIKRTIAANVTIEKLCEEYGFVYLNIYDSYEGPNMILDSDLTGFNYTLEPKRALRAIKNMLP